MKNEIIEQVEELVKGAVTAEEFAEIEKVITEAKGKVLLDVDLGFWKGKTPCWDMCKCPSSIRQECPSFKKRDLPCWEIEGTYSKVDDYVVTCHGKSICHACCVYKRFGNGKPIKIKLFAQGLNPTFVQQARENRELY